MNDSLTVMRKLRLENGSTDIDDFIREYKPTTVLTGNSIQQSPGKAYPTNNLLRVRTVRLAPVSGAVIVGDASGINLYNEILATVNYQIPPFAIDEQDAQEQGDPVAFLKHSGSGGGEFLKLPSAGLEWATGTEPVSEEANAGIFVGFTKHSVQWPQVINPPWDKLESLKGRVNDAAFKLRNYEYPAETLLYESHSFSQEVMTDGITLARRAWNITLHFTSKQVPSEEDGETVGGFNHFWKDYDFATTGKYSGFYRLQRTDGAAGTKKIYLTAALGGLFTADQGS